MTLLSGVAAGIAASPSAASITELLPALWGTYTSLRSETHRAFLLSSLGKLAARLSPSPLRQETFSRCLNAISTFRKDEVRSSAIEQMVNSLDSGSSIELLCPLLDGLTELAIAIEDETLRVNALAGSGFGIVRVLSFASHEPASQGRLARYLTFFDDLCEDESRVNYLTGLASALEVATNTDWSSTYCESIVDLISSIHADESRSDTITSVADALADCRHAPWIERQFERLAQLALSLRDPEEQAATLFSSSGLLGVALNIDPRPSWVIPFVERTLTLFTDHGSPYAKTFAISSFGQELLPKIGEPTVLIRIATALLTLTTRLRQLKHKASGLCGLACGIIQLPPSDLRVDLLSRVLTSIRGLDDEEAIAASLAHILSESFSIGSPLSTDPLTKSILQELLLSTVALDNEDYRVSLIAGPILETRGSIAQALSHVATQDWEDVYRVCLCHIADLKSPKNRLYGFLNFAETATGRTCLPGELRYAPWIKDILLNVLLAVASDLAEASDSLTKDVLDWAGQELHLRLAFLVTHVERDRAGITPTFRNRAELYTSLIALAAQFSETPCVEKDPATGVVVFDIVPRVALLVSMASDFMQDPDHEFTSRFFPALLSITASLSTPQSRAVVLAALIRGLSTAPGRPETMACLHKVSEHLRPDQEEFKTARMSAMRLFADLGDRPHATRIALSFASPLTRIEAIQTLSAHLGADLPEEMAQTVKELVSAESLLGSPKANLLDNIVDRVGALIEKSLARTTSPTRRAAAAPATKTVHSYVFQQASASGSMWQVNFHLERGTVPALTGMKYLHFLLVHAGEDHYPLTVMAECGELPSADPAFDYLQRLSTPAMREQEGLEIKDCRTAKFSPDLRHIRDTRIRIALLQDEINTARKRKDAERLPHLLAMQKELKESSLDDTWTDNPPILPRGRMKAIADCVGANIDRAIKEISKQGCPKLARHLRVSIDPIRTSRPNLAYRPAEQDIHWVT